MAAAPLPTALGMGLVAAMADHLFSTLHAAYTSLASHAQQNLKGEGGGREGGKGIAYQPAHV